MLAAAGLMAAVDHASPRCPQFGLAAVIPQPHPLAGPKRPASASWPYNRNRAARHSARIIQDQPARGSSADSTGHGCDNRPIAKSRGGPAEHGRGRPNFYRICRGASPRAGHGDWICPAVGQPCCRLHRAPGAGPSADGPICCSSCRPILPPHLGSRWKGRAERVPAVPGLDVPAVRRPTSHRKTGSRYTGTRSPVPEALRIALPRSVPVLQKSQPAASSRLCGVHPKPTHVCARAWHEHATQSHAT